MALGTLSFLLPLRFRSPIPQLSRWVTFVLPFFTSLAVSMYVCYMNGSAVIVAVVHVAAKRIIPCQNLCCIVYCIVAIASRFI